MGIFIYRGTQKQKIQLRPKVFFIGTHKDQLESGSAMNVITSIDQDLQESTSQFHHIIEFESESRMLLTVDNFSKDETDFQKIRSAVERVVDRHEFEMVSPSNWLIYSLALRKLTSDVISYEQCFEIAKQCGIVDEKELDEALNFIHTKMGLIRYYPYENVKDIVVIKPQFLYKMISELIVKTFTFDNAGKQSADEFKQKGIFSLQDFERIDCKRGTTGMKPSQFAKLLEIVRIAAPVSYTHLTLPTIYSV